MKIFVLAIVAIVLYVINVEVTDDLRLNSEIYNLYIEGFEKYIHLNESGDLNFDKEKLEKYFLSEGYDVLVNIETSVLCIEEKEKNGFSESVKCCFYMVKNNEIK